MNEIELKKSALDTWNEQKKLEATRALNNAHTLDSGRWLGH